MLGNLRSPQKVMNLARLGSSHQSRLSFMRTLLRRLKREKWQFERSVWNINQNSKGYAVYQAVGPKRTYSLLAFSHPLLPGKATDRVVATAWDASFTLFDGVPTDADIERLHNNIPLQEAGRVNQSSLSVSRANRSVRMFKHVVDALAVGQQPETEVVNSVGYLMRTTAVYGSGKLGAADRQRLMDRQELCGAFQLEMLSVWLTRAFTVDLAEFEAKILGGDRAVNLCNKIKLRLGVGNATGLGMAPFLVNHPSLLNYWIIARETALARVRALLKADIEKISVFNIMLKRAHLSVQGWHSKHPIQVSKKAELLIDIKIIFKHLDQLNTADQYYWDKLYCWSEQNLSLEGQELLAMLMMEPYPDLVDELAENLQVDEHCLQLIDGSMTVAALCIIIEKKYSWALSINYEHENNRCQFWYVSEEKLEPRLGNRFEESGAELELPLCIGWHVSQLYTSLKTYRGDGHVAGFLVHEAKYRHTVRRVQQIEAFPYMEIHDNLISKDMSPIDMLRLKLSFFGATNFDPKSDRWIRINMFQYAPYPDQIEIMPEDDWVFPTLS